MSVTLKGLFAVGDRMMSIVDITGPSSYTQITAGTPPNGPTGGQSLSAQACGLKAIEDLFGGLDNSGKYQVEGVALKAGSTPFPNSAALMWIIAHTGAEESGATDLHTYTVRLTVIGR
jgi:hypothetical protein